MDNAIAIDNNHLTMNDTARTLSGDHESRVTDTGTSIVQSAGCLNTGDPMTTRIYGEGGANPTLQNGGTGGTIRQGVLVSPVVAIGVDAYNQATTGGASKPLGHSATDTDHTPAVALNHIMRRLTPVECERLQGFPDGWTRIPYRGKPAEECTDSPRYRALGNSWATNCAEYILRRIVAAFQLDMVPDNN